MVNANSSQQTAVLIVEQLLQQAIEYHQAGQLQNAERLYRVVLKIQPSHADAQFNLFLIAEQLEQVISDLPKYKTALEADPTQGQHWLNYAEALLITGRAMEALLVIKNARKCGLKNTAIQALQQRAEDTLLHEQAASTHETSALLEPNTQRQPPVHLDDADLIKQPKNKKPLAKKKSLKKPKSIARFNSKS